MRPLRSHLNRIKESRTLHLPTLVQCQTNEQTLSLIGMKEELTREARQHSVYQCYENGDRATATGRVLRGLPFSTYADFSAFLTPPPPQRVRTKWKPPKHIRQMDTEFSSEIGTELRDWAVGQAGGSCYSWAALSSNDSKTLYLVEEREANGRVEKTTSSSS